ncbi:MAG: type II toxin-antitoxin system ParD family antitoxin [Cytophagales bacterium]|nr:type II toxin-antitoxin system ParD family antitoxin [Cytophagales bacterium]
MGKNTSVALADHFEYFVSERVNSGSYNNASEVIRAGLRILEEQENPKNILAKALKEGEESGFVEDFDPDLLLDDLHSRHKV